MPFEVSSQWTNEELLSAGDGTANKLNQYYYVVSSGTFPGNPIGGKEICFRLGKPYYHDGGGWKEIAIGNAFQASSAQLNNLLASGTKYTQAYSNGCRDGASDLIIGANNNGANYRLDGIVDEGFFYTEALTDSQAEWLYNSGNGRTYAELAGFTPKIIMF